MIRPVCNTRSMFCVVNVAVAVALLTGCGHSQHVNTTYSPQIPAAAPQSSHAETENPSKKTPVKDSLIALLEKDAKTDHVFPSGVQVKSVTLENGVASIDFSHEFSELANSGETVESDAQHALRKAIAKFTTIEKMRVTVDGKPFESQATDWNTPFPVRDTQPNTQRKSPSVGSDSASR